MTVEQLAYLKTPEKIRAALIYAGHKPLSLEAIKRRLDAMPRKTERVRVAEPVAGDAMGYRPPVVRFKPEPKRDTYARARYLPKAVENLQRKMMALQDEAEAIGAKEYLNCLKAANEAFEREVKIAKLQGQVLNGGRK